MQINDQRIVKILQHQSSLLPMLPQEKKSSIAVIVGKVSENFIKRIDLPLTVMGDITCALWSTSKEVALAIDKCVYYYSIADKTHREKPVAQCSGRILDMKIYRGCLIIAEGSHDPDSKKTIKIFEKNGTIKEITNPPFRTGYFYCNVQTQINAYGRVFTIFKDKLIFIGADGAVRQVDLDRSDTQATRLTDSKAAYHMLDAHGHNLVGITPQFLVFIESETWSKEKKVCLGGVLTALEVTHDFVIVSQYRTDIYGSFNRLLVIDFGINRRAELEVQISESIRHLKHFAHGGKRYIVAVSFGYSSTVQLIEYISKTDRFSFLKRLDNLNTNPLCSWINSVHINAENASILLVGPQNFVTMLKLKSDA
jgi:hypothetical protein